MHFLDTDVLVEIQRAQPAAKRWLESLRGPVALPAAVAWEMLFGSRNKAELQRSHRFLSNFDVEQLSSEDSALVQQLIVEHRLSTGMGLPDLLIAAQVLSRKATLYTFNFKHFSAIPAIDARVPYER